MLITLKTDIRPPTAPVLGPPSVLSTTSISVPLLIAATDPSGVTSYTLEYSTSLNDGYVEATSAAVFPQTVTGLTPSTQYFFRAKAIDSYGNSGPYSGIVSATTQDAAPITGLTWPAHVPGYLSLIPGVGGYGMNTVAGSGRHLATPATTVILVNSLAAGNTGSALTGLGANVFGGTFEYAWRHAASPKVIIPIISGMVTVQDSIPCQTGTPPRPGYVSYYGQAAPNPGLFLRGANVVCNGASNVAIWHLRSYMGDDVTGLPAGNRDCLSSGYGAGTTQQVCLINCELAWSVDELLDLYRSHSQVTAVGCAFIEPLHISTVVHPEDGPGVDHGFGPIVGGDTGNATQTSTISLFRNLWAHSTGRNPLISAQTYVHANNLHYNHGRPTVGAGSGVQIIGAGATAPNFANILGNGFVRGPNNNTSLVAVTAGTTLPTSSAGYSFANAQFGWTNPTNQNGFFTSSPSGYLASSVLTDAYPGSWGTGLSAVLQWASNPLSPTLTEWSDFVTLMDRTVGAQPRWRTTQYGRVAAVFNQIRDRLAGVTQTNQFVDTVTQAGGWFTVPSVTINPLNPGSHWHAPLPTGSDRDTPYTTGTFSDGKSRVGYTRLEEWAYEQHLYVTSFDTVAPSIPASVTAQAQSQTTIRIAWAASTDTGGTGLAGYRVYRSTTSGGSYSQVGGNLSSSTLSFDDTTLTTGVTRFYRVTAFDGAGNESSASVVVSATTHGVTVSRLPFTDGLESGNFSTWNTVGGVVTSSTAERYEGSRSASTTATIGQASDNYLEYNFGDEISVGGTPTGMNDLWIRFAHKWASNYVDSDPNIIAQKLLLLNSHNPATGRRRYQVTFNVFNNGTYFFDIYRWNEDTSFGGTIHNITLPSFPRVKGRWEEFVFRVRQNTPGASDGILECWTKAEGDTAYTQQLSRTNLNLRDSTSITPNRLIGLSNYDTLTTRSGNRYWDGFYLSTTAWSVSAPTADNDGFVVSNFANYDPDTAIVQSLEINSTVPMALTNGAIGTIQNEVWWNGASVPVATFRPPTGGDSYSGFSNIYFWKNATKAVRQSNVRWEFKLSDLHLLDNAGLPKWIILETKRQLSTSDAVLTERPMLFLTHCTEADPGAPYRFANTLVCTPAQDTVRSFQATNITPAPVFGQAGQTGYFNQRQGGSGYIRATSGTDDQGNPIADNEEYFCVELRVNVMSTVSEPNGVIAFRIYRRNGQVWERATAWTNTPNDQGERPLINTNFISRIDVFGGGYYNLGQPSNANLYTKVGRRITMACNYQPTVGRAWLGPPTGFVQ